jgi:hypothetical protein
VTLLERVAEPAAVGAGILLQPKRAGRAVRAWACRGAAARRLAHAARGDPGPHGVALLELPLPDFGRGLDHALVLRRSHLYRVRLAAVRAHPAGRILPSGPGPTCP